MTRQDLVRELATRITVIADPEGMYIAMLPGLAAMSGACFGGTAETARDNFARAIAQASVGFLEELEAASRVGGTS